MELIRRTALIYQAGSSDKVYEVDLCQTGADRYVVNFRYGRRGTTLKEGSKTIQAVPLAEAQRIFDRLVDSKIQKGYRDISAQPGSQTTAPPTPVEQTTQTLVTTSDPPHLAILNRLANRDNRKWPLERAIWRAGELKIREATPLLIQLIGIGEPLRDYCIAWALGWCGDESAIAPLNRLYHRSNPDFIRRIAWEALFKLSNEQTQATMRSEKIEQLPSELRDLARNGTKEVFTTALRTYLKSGYYGDFAVLDTIYQIDNEYVRPALLNILCETPLKPNYFQRIRHIFKMAEYRLDAEVFGILAYAFEKEPGTFSSKRRVWEYDSENYRYHCVNERPYTEELKSPQSNKAYSEQTHQYLRRRVWRTLKQLGEEGDANYVNLAASILLQYSDEDAEEIRQSTIWRWNTQLEDYERFTRYWDAYAGYLIFNHILYENSPRYVYHPKAWHSREGYKLGDPEPKVREEAFPELWQQNPAALVRLLLESDCRPVHHFAVKPLRANKQFCDRLPTETLIQFLNKPYEVTAQLGFELAIERYNPAKPNSELVLTLANCTFPEARTQAFRWIEEKREFFLASSDFIASLVTSKHADTRAFARRLLRSAILSDDTARLLIGRIIVTVLSLQENQAEMAREIGETLLIGLAPQLRNLGFAVILDLLHHPMVEVQELGARILLNHDTRPVDFPPDLIESLLASPHESVRTIGVRIFGQLPDEKLMSDRTLIVAMAINSVADIRNAIRPVIRRLSSNNSDFAGELIANLIDVLILPEKHEGVHKDVVRLMQEDIPDWMSKISKEKAMQLLRAKSSVVQELGGVVLRENCQRFLPEFEISEIVKLANHEIIAVREAAREMFLRSLNRIRSNTEEMLSAVRLLESKWEDSREFARRIFSTEFTSEHWTPEVTISICDSVREDVRSFGRDLATRHFQESYGQEYLLKFCEHPSKDMQMFATNYLENYAVNNPERLRELTPYFVRVLCAVNRGRIAKQRIFAFLDAEAQKSEEAATIIAEILTRQSVTMAIGDKAAAIQTMVKISKNYPQLSLPIQVKPVVEVRS